jgi:predicted ester cyclase
MSTEDNKALVRRVYEEVANQRNLAAVDQLAALNFVGHFTSFPPLQGAEGLKQAISTVLTAFPDFHFTIDDMIAEGDEVAVRLTIRGRQSGPMMGIPPTSKQITISALHIYRVAGGKIVEGWVNSDDLGMMQQLGVIPTQG